MLKARIVVPKGARKGDIVEIKTLVNHAMETGYRRDHMGKPIPRDILKRFSCSYVGAEIFAMDLYTGVAANPFVAFSMVAQESGDLVFTWTDENAQTHTQTERLEVV